MAALAVLTPILTVASTALSVMGGIQQANAAKQNAAFESAQLQEQAQEANAAASREAASKIRYGQLAQSRAQAVAGASGGSPSDPTVVNLEQNIAGQSEYNALTALWSGSAEAAGLQTRANAAIASGNNEANADIIGAVGSGLKGGLSMFDKYGESPGSGGGVNYTSYGADIGYSNGSPTLMGGGYAGGYG